jgi:uncharacterized C2H2 Zn-finger protein
MLQQACGEDCLRCTQCQLFKSGRTSIKDDHVEKVHAVIYENRCLTVREVSEEVGVC